MDSEFVKPVKFVDEREVQISPGKATIRGPILAGELPDIDPTNPLHYQGNLVM